MMNLKTVITVLFIFCYKFTACTEVILVQPARQTAGATYAVENFTLPDATVDRAFNEDTKESMNTIENYIASLGNSQTDLQLKELLLKKAIAGSKLYIAYILMDKLLINKSILDLAEEIRKNSLEALVLISAENSNNHEWKYKYEKAAKKFNDSKQIYDCLKDKFENKQQKEGKNRKVIIEIRTLINKNNIEEIEKIINDNGLNILYAKDNNGLTPLMMAINDERIEIIKFFLEKLRPTGALNDENLNITKNAEKFANELLKLENLTVQRKSKLELIYSLLKNHNSGGCCTIL